MQHIPAPGGHPGGHQGTIGMNLEYSELWKSFHQIGTEMVITKSGRRMFPYCNVSVSGLLPYAKYVIMVDMVSVDNSKYKWNNERWEVAGKAEPQPPCRTYLHPDSPALGSHWMKQSISFLKLKLTNNLLDQRGHLILHSMHRYRPFFHVVQADDRYSVRWSVFQTFTFPETSFTAVTVYQNSKITKLKIDHNPFAKGFREDGTHRKRNRAQNNQLGADSRARKLKPSDKETTFRCYSDTDVLRLPYDHHREHSEAILLAKDVPIVQDDLMSSWGGEPDPGRSLQGEGSMDYSNSEQLVPGHANYQPHRTPNFKRMSSPPTADAQRSLESRSTDAATVPEPAHSRPLPSIREGSPHCVGTKPWPGPSARPLHRHYNAEHSLGHWNGALAGQYSSPAYPSPHPHHHHQHHVMSEAGTNCSGYHQGNAAEWSQYSLFSYSC